MVGFGVGTREKVGTWDVVGCAGVDGELVLGFVDAGCGVVGEIVVVGIDISGTPTELLGAGVEGGVVESVGFGVPWKLLG